MPAAISVKSRSKLIGRSSSGCGRRDGGHACVLRRPSVARHGYDRGGSWLRRRVHRSVHRVLRRGRAPDPAGGGRGPRTRTRRPRTRSGVRPAVTLRPAEAERRRAPARLERGLVGRAHEHDVRSHHLGDDPGQVGVVGAPEQQCVDARRRPAPAAARPGRSPASPPVSPRSTNSTKPGQAAEVSSTGAPVASTARS